MKKYIFLAACALGLSLTSCEDFLDYTPTAVVDEEQALSEPEKMVNSLMHVGRLLVHLSV